jgi:hypothetical protein
MAKHKDSEVEILLKQLLAIEMWRGGLSQDAIRKRLRLSPNKVNEILKGVSRHLSSQPKAAK